MTRSAPSASARREAPRNGAPSSARSSPAGALAEASEEHGGFRLTEKGEAILFGRGTDRARAPSRTSHGGRAAARAKAAPTGSKARPPRCSRRLRSLRLTIARDEGVPAYMVFPDRTLIEMAELRPATREALRAVQGVGERKLSLYGDAFDAIREAG